MTTQNNQGSLLDVLKKKMRAMKDELETAREEADENLHKYQTEVRRREEVCAIIFFLFAVLITFKSLSPQL